ncbi:MAG: transposase [Planctomycetia bacterium]|nr:transposase [Planctomycetia bacterium]
MSQALPFEATCVSAGPRTEPRFELTDERWLLIAAHFRDPPASPAGGRPRASARACFEGILWVLRTGARWRDLPPRYPSPATCWRRHRDWTASGLWERAWSQLLRALERRGTFDAEQSLADGTFAAAKKGAAA